MTLKEIQQRNYQATVCRGKITPATTDSQFIAKIKEETSELELEIDLPFIHEVSIGFEMADIIITVLSYAKHKGIDIQTALEQKTIYNENRND
jgi:NTP pyrophosphatase (non-canonical NTP hydrolase)